MLRLRIKLRPPIVSDFLAPEALGAPQWSEARATWDRWSWLRCSVRVGSIVLLPFELPKGSVDGAVI